MFNRETTKGMSNAEYVAEIYIWLLDIPTEELGNFFEEVDGLLVDKQLTQGGYEYFEAIKTYIISRRMKEALN